MQWGGAPHTFSMEALSERMRFASAVAQRSASAWPRCSTADLRAARLAMNRSAAALRRCLASSARAAASRLRSSTLAVAASMVRSIFCFCLSAAAGEEEAQGAAGGGVARGGRLPPRREDGRKAITPGATGFLTTKAAKAGLLDARDVPHRAVLDGLRE